MKFGTNRKLPRDPVWPRCYRDKLDGARPAGSYRCNRRKRWHELPADVRGQWVDWSGHGNVHRR